MNALVDNHQSIPHADVVVGAALIVGGIGWLAAAYLPRLLPGRRTAAVDQPDQGDTGWDVAKAEAEGWAPCVECKGSGLTSAGDREHETGEWVTEPCTFCNGDGHVDADWVAECANHKTPFWAGDGCDHVITLCAECREHCPECMNEARDDAAYDAYREMELLGDSR